jgi:5-methylcytosine-specific restriction endonuclease McrA
MELKRDLVKYIRDKAKARYEKGTECYICESVEELDFHHYHGLTELLEKWLTKNKLNPSTADEIMGIRDQFIEEHMKELYDDCVTLCHKCHLKLHSIYGKRPILATAGKQSRWVEKKRVKNGILG